MQCRRHLKKLIVGVMELLLLGSLPQPEASAAQQVDRTRIWTISLPAPCAPGSDFSLKVKVGLLPNGSTLELRLLEGVWTGSVAPYGARARKEGGVYELALPSAALHEATIRIVGKVVLAPGIVRPALASELIRVSLLGHCGHG